MNKKDKAVLGKGKKKLTAGHTPKDTKKVKPPKGGTGESGT